MHELWQNMTVCQTYEIASGSYDNAQKWFVWAADATRKFVNKQVFEHVFLSRARGNLCTFGPTYDLDIFWHADPGCCWFFRNIGKQLVFDAPGPPGTGALRASDATSFSAAAPENGPFWAFWYSRCRIAQPLFKEKNRGVEETPKVTYRPVARNDVFCTCVRTGRPNRVARI